jgi:hypothetical protein
LKRLTEIFRQAFFIGIAANFLVRHAAALGSDKPVE